MGDNSRETHLDLTKLLEAHFPRSLSDGGLDRIDEVRSALFARITATVISHETSDWPGYYDKLSALICRVVAQSSLSDKSKFILTCQLMEHVRELEKWWPRLRREN